MTNKEAVTILNSIKMFFCREDGTPFSVGYDAITKAVKQLERLPDEHGDLIDIDKLKRAFCNHCDGRDNMNGEPNCTEPCFDIGLMDCMPVIIAGERKDDEQID